MDTPTLYAIKPSVANNSWQRFVDKFRQLCGYRFPRLGPFAFAGILNTLPPVIETQLFPGIKATLDLRDQTQLWTYWYGTRFEDPTPQILRDWAVGAEFFFDIGANYGFFSFLLYSASRHLRIFSFEPNPETFSHLSKICEQNSLSSIVPQAFGLSDCEGEFPFHLLRRNTGHSSFAPVCEDSDHGGLPTEAKAIMVQTRRFDDFVEELGLIYPSSPTWIAKIDVEGFEYKVLRGMKNTLERKAFKGLCIEVFPENLALVGSTVKEIDTFMGTLGYIQMRAAQTWPTAHKHPHCNAFYKPLTGDQSESQCE